MSEPEQRDPASSEAPIETPPDGSTCAEHPERPALATCPRCGGYACLGCWHHSVRRCHACLMRDPSAAAPPIPWEDPKKNIVSRWLGTLATSFRPTATAPAFARGDVAKPGWFWLITFVPLAILTGVIPYTHTLAFGPSFAVHLLGAPDTTAIVLDVLRAVGLGALVSMATLTALTLPFVSLARAYAEKGYEIAPQRVVLYRSFLLPLSTVLFHIVGWGAPASTAEATGALAVAGVMSVVPLALLFGALRSTARMASGAGPLASYAIALVPFVVMIFAQELLGRALAPLMPDPEVLRQAAEQLGQTQP